MRWIKLWGGWQASCGFKLWVQCDSGRGKTEPTPSWDECNEMHVRLPGSRQVSMRLQVFSFQICEVFFFYQLLYSFFTLKFRTLPFFPPALHTPCYISDFFNDRISPEAHLHFPWQLSPSLTFLCGHTVWTPGSIFISNSVFYFLFAWYLVLPLIF